MVNIRVSKVDLKASHADIVRWANTDPGLNRDLDRRGTRGQAAARRYVGVDTGTLLSTIRKHRGHNARGPYLDLIAGRPGLTDYMGWHHDGTAPHTIMPRRARALRFPTAGGVVFASRVRHPGTTGTRFLTRALDHMQ